MVERTIRFGTERVVFAGDDTLERRVVRTGEPRKRRYVTEREERQALVDEEAEVARFLGSRSEASRLMETNPRLVSVCESPIERLFAWALIARMQDHANPLRASEYHAEQLVACACDHPNRVFVSPQSTWGQYRVDFMMVHRMQGVARPLRVAIECDGHEFHERTKAQAANDRSRDRAMTKTGIYVMRFTGSEIHADAMKCVRDVVDLISNYRANR